MKTSFRISRDALEKLLGITPEMSDEDVVDRINGRIALNTYGDNLRRIDFEKTKVTRGEREIKITVEIDVYTELSLQLILREIIKHFPVS
jgi:hypothetical protein